MSRELSPRQRLVKNIYNRIVRKIGQFPDGYKLIDEKLEELVGNEGLVTEEIEKEIENFFLKDNATVKATLTVIDSEPDISAKSLSSNLVQTENNLTPVSSNMEYLPVNNSNNGMLSKAEAKEIVFNQAEELGIDLSMQQIKSMADSILATTQQIEDKQQLAKSLILEFIQYNENQFLDNVQRNTNEVVDAHNKSSQTKAMAMNQSYDHLQIQLEDANKQFFRTVENATNDLEQYFQNIRTK